MDGRLRMAPLTWVAGVFRAEVLAARLRSEGIDAQLQGALSNPYSLTVGDMARVDVYVPEDQLEDARYVLLADEVDATLAPPSEWWNAGGERSAGPPPWIWWVTAALLVTCVLGAAFGLLRYW